MSKVGNQTQSKLVNNNDLAPDFKINTAVGGSTNHIFYENDINITTDYVIPAGKNAMTAGPVNLNNGVNISISNGSTWTIV